LDFFPSLIRDPGVKKAPDPGSATLVKTSSFEHTPTEKAQKTWGDVTKKANPVAKRSGVKYGNAISMNTYYTACCHMPKSFFFSQERIFMIFPFLRCALHLIAVAKSAKITSTYFLLSHN
jgi:hypothetical protein